MRIQLVLPRHEIGELAFPNQLNMPPPVGLLTLAVFLESKIPGIAVEVWDGNTIAEQELIDQLDAPLIGISVWFTNYTSGKRLAHEVKRRDPKIQIFFGGPHVSGFQHRILTNNAAIDAVLDGDGELSLLEYLNGQKLESVPGMSYRAGDGINHNPRSSPVQLDEIPPLNIQSLQTPYEWQTECSNSSAFPLSGIRGCIRKERCEYCSIPTLSVRKRSPNRYWHEVDSLYQSEGIDYFFETGDIFDPKYAKKLAAEKPYDIPIRLRIYSYPGLVSSNNVQNLTRIGVDNVFMGVESILIWNRNHARTMAKAYTPKCVEQEIDLLWQNNITTTASFIVGLPGETNKTLDKNFEWMKQISGHKGVKEVVINRPFPLPGSNYFDWCVESEQIVAKYKERMGGDDIRFSDDIDFHLLSQLFVETFAMVPMHEYESMLDEVPVNFAPKVATWRKSEDSTLKNEIDSCQVNQPSKNGKT